MHESAKYGTSVNFSTTQWQIFTWEVIQVCTKLPIVFVFVVNLCQHQKKKL